MYVYKNKNEYEHEMCMGLFDMICYLWKNIMLSGVKAESRRELLFHSISSEEF